MNYNPFLDDARCEILEAIKASGGGSSLLSPTVVSAIKDVTKGQQLFFTEGLGIDTVQDVDGLELNGYIPIGNVDISANSSSYVSMAVNPQGNKMAVLFGNSVQEYDISSPGSVSLVYTGNTVSISGQTSNAIDLDFSNDGDQLYVLDESENIYKYDLATNGSIVGMTYSTDTVSISGQTSSANAIHMQFDDNAFYITTTSPESVSKYNMPATNTLAGSSFSSQTGGLDTFGNIVGAAVSRDGTNILATVSGIGDGIYQYEINTPYVPSSATTTQSRTNQSADSSSPGRIATTKDDKFIYLKDGNNVNLFSVFIPKTTSFSIGASTEDALAGSDFTALIRTSGSVDYVGAILGDILWDVNGSLSTSSVPGASAKAIVIENDKAILLYSDVQSRSPDLSGFRAVEGPSVSTTLVTVASISVENGGYLNGIALNASSVNIADLYITVDDRPEVQLTSINFDPDSGSLPLYGFFNSNITIKMRTSSGSIDPYVFYCEL